MLKSWIMKTWKDIPAPTPTMYNFEINIPPHHLQMASNTLTTLFYPRIAALTKEKRQTKLIMIFLFIIIIKIFW